MAALNEILVGRFNKLLTRLLNISGGAPSPQLTPEITPVLVAIPDAPSYSWQKNELLMVAGVTTGAAIGKQAYIQVGNQPGSQQLIEIEQILISNLSAGLQNYVFGQTTISTAAVQRVSSRDSRINPGLGNVQTGPGRFTSGSDSVADGVAGLAGAFNIPNIGLLANTSQVVAVPFVLGPGDAFTIANNALNAAVTAAIFWRARPAAEGELQL